MRFASRNFTRKMRKNIASVVNSEGLKKTKVPIVSKEAKRFNIRSDIAFV